MLNNLSANELKKSNFNQMKQTFIRYAGIISLLLFFLFIAVPKVSNQDWFLFAFAGINISLVLILFFWKWDKQQKS